LGGRIIPAAVSLAGLAIYVRVLTPAEYGLYALVIASAGIVNSIVFQWLGMSLGRFLPAYRDQPQKITGTIFIGFVATVLISAAGAAAYMFFTDGKSPALLIALTLTLAWSQAHLDLKLRMLNATLSPSRYSIVASSKALLGLGFSLAL